MDRKSGTFGKEYSLVRALKMLKALHLSMIFCWREFPLLEISERWAVFVFGGCIIC